MTGEISLNDSNGGSETELAQWYNDSYNKK